MVRTTRAALLAAVLMAASAMSAEAATATRAPAGKLKTGEAVEAVTLKNSHGVSVKIYTYGATLADFLAPDRNGKLADIALGYDTASQFQEFPNYFGGTIGRYANRIAGGKFVLDGKTYQLPLNDKTNSLHGGDHGYDKRVWTIASVKSGPAASVVLTLSSPDGDSGYPGKLDVTVTYSLDEQGALTIDFAATTTKPTVINMTNHALFNMAGEGAPEGAMGNILTIPAKAYTPVNAALIPTGEKKPVAGTVFDFTKPRVIAGGLRDGRDPQIVAGRGYDHNFVLNKGQTATPQLAARLEDPKSGRVLEVLSTEPGLQFYSGNFLDGTLVGKKGHVYRMGDGIALEPQKFPDTPNQPAFGTARVEPGKPYHHVMIYRVSVAK